MGQELPQTLKLADDLMPLVAHGTKQVTVRNGKRNIIPGKLVFESTGGTTAPLIVTVTEVVVSPVKDLPDWAIVGEGLTSRDELVEVLRRFYPDVTAESIVTAVEFKLNG